MIFSGMYLSLIVNSVDVYVLRKNGEQSISVADCLCTELKRDDP